VLELLLRESDGLPLPPEILVVQRADQRVFDSEAAAPNGKDLHRCVVVDRLRGEQVRRQSIVVAVDNGDAVPCALPPLARMERIARVGKEDAPIKFQVSLAAEELVEVGIAALARLGLDDDRLLAVGVQPISENVELKGLEGRVSCAADQEPATRLERGRNCPLELITVDGLDVAGPQV
jgi:hypothetical protein